MSSNELPPEGKPPRRKRYGGTHPRRFDQKYKELNPEKYAADVEKVKARGQTPAGSHLPIMLNEVMAALRPAPGDIAIDCTLGHGGHCAEIARRIAPGGKMLAVDLDGDELKRTVQRLAAMGLTISAHHTNFAGLGKVLADEQVSGVDVLLADLGVSSMQLDRPDRGFSFKSDGPLDMRMDRSRGATAVEWLKSTPVDEIEKILTAFGDEPDAAAVSREIALAAARGLRSTRELVSVILRAKGIDPKSYKRSSAFETHPAARTFQALRMAVNREPANLQHLLRLLPHILNGGGRAALITFHSGEEKLVAEAFAKGRELGIYNAGSDEPARPAPEEVRANPRARSARLHWVRRALDGC